MTERPAKSASKPMAGSTGAAAAARRRSGCSSAHAAAVSGNFASAGDLYTYCRHCGKRREGSMADLLAPCSCGGAAP